MSESMPQFFALAPLYDHLVTRQVDIKSLGDDGTLGDATVPTIFTAIDVELWARRFLGDMDRFLAPSASARIKGLLGLSAVLAHVIDSKRNIASGIADQLQGVFDYSVDETDPDPLYQKGLQDARNTLAQLLNGSLIKAYDIPVIGQYATAADPVPVPFRIHPLPPTIVDQAILPTFDSTDVLQQLSLWSYKLTFAHECAHQDMVRITTQFNRSSRVSQQSPSQIGVDLFNTLAQYMAVADKLWMLLDKASPVNAVKTFADLVATIANHWTIRLSHSESGHRPDGSFAAQASRTFGFRVTYSENGKLIESVSLTRDPSQPGSGDTWPAVEVMLPDGVSVPLIAQPSDAPSHTIGYLPKNGTEAPAFARQTLQLTWHGLEVAAFQNARACLSIVRNEDLLHDPSHPENTKLRTNPVFLLKAGEVVGNSIVPLIERYHQQEIKGATLLAALDDAIQTLFPPDRLVANTRATWQLDYSYELARSDTPLGDYSPIRARVPVTLYPDGPLAGAAQVLAKAGEGWIDNFQPAFDGGSWILSVTLHSALESAERPLFTAELFYPIKKDDAAS
ncbi:hypothetical protein [Pinirhizobacter soli]|uniref:hypothetical protein n=1 Tax=Pinirhizobacter soli TaxID=2786953 RepID=UPI00202A97AD|nr:hypothetical protein [Pinirhizobacter soli]